MGRIFVIGDIHGASRALRQCLERGSFNYKEDTLICLGDVSDGWPNTKACVDELLLIKKLVYILGNHDLWTREWMKSGLADEHWLVQGGLATLHSYHNGIPAKHKKLFDKALPYFIYENKLFVHAGIDPKRRLKEQDESIFLWDRNFARTALHNHSQGIDTKLTDFDEVYIGHTPIAEPKPLHACDVWLMDTGAGWSGVLSMMDVHTKEVFTSDPVPSLYPGVAGRRKLVNIKTS